MNSTIFNFIFLFTTLNCAATGLLNYPESRKTQISANRRLYKIDLDSNMKLLIVGKSLEAKTAVYLIPRTKNEWMTYYSFVKRAKSFKKAFYKLDTLFAKYACSNYRGAFRLYLNMSLFIDQKPFKHGEYYDNYFSSIDLVIDQQHKEFCSTYPHFNKALKVELSQYYDIECK